MFYIDFVDFEQGTPANASFRAVHCSVFAQNQMHVLTDPESDVTDFLSLLLSLLKLS